MKLNCEQCKRIETISIIWLCNGFDDKIVSPMGTSLKFLIWMTIQKVQPIIIWILNPVFQIIRKNNLKHIGF